MDATDARGRRCPSLPVELWEMIARFTDERSRWQLRRVSKQLERISTPLCFEKIRVRFQRRAIYRFYKVATSDRLRGLVKTMVLQREQVLPFFKDFSDWEKELDLPTKPTTTAALGSSETPDTTFTGAATSSSSLSSSSSSSAVRNPKILTAEEWGAIPPERRRTIFYEQYEKDRIFPSQFVDSLQLREVGSYPSAVSFHRRDRSILAVFQYIGQNLEELVTRFESLATFEVDDETFLFDLDYTHWWQLRWHRVVPKATMEAFWMAQLSILLRALGWATYQRKEDGLRLRRLQLPMSSSGFWTAQDLGKLWYRLALRLSQAPDVYASPSNVSNVRFGRQLFFIEHCLLHLTDLDCKITAPYEILFEKSEPLADFLHQGRVLEHVNLRLDDQITPSEQSPRWLCHGRLRMRMLDLIYWPRLRDLRLTMRTTGRSLERFLEKHSRTLKQLHLVGVMLLPDLVNGSATELVEMRWETVLAKISSSLQLDEIYLADLWDGRPTMEGSWHGVRVILSSRLKRLSESQGIHWTHHETPIFDYILCRNTGSLPPLVFDEFAKQHLRSCDSCRSGYTRWLHSRNRNTTISRGPSNASRQL